MPIKVAKLGSSLHLQLSLHQCVSDGPKLGTHLRSVREQWSGTIWDGRLGHSGHSPLIGMLVKSCRPGHGHSGGQHGHFHASCPTSLWDRCGHRQAADLSFRLAHSNAAPPHELFTRPALASAQQAIHLSGIPEAWQNDWSAAAAKNVPKQFASIFYRNYSVLFRMRQAVCIMMLP